MSVCGREAQEYFRWNLLQGLPGAGEEPMFFPFCFSFEQCPALEANPGPSFRLHTGYGCIDQFNVKLTCIRTDASLIAELHYDFALCSVADIACLADQFETLLQSAITQAEGKIGKLKMMSERERQRLLVEFNATQTVYPQDRCLHHLFEEQARRTPNAVALAYGQQQLTYAELDRRANQLANYLQALEVGPEVLVGICMERSLEMVIGLMGILKAGGAYVPLDPTYPQERLAFMLKDAQMPVLLTQERLSQNLSLDAARAVCLDRDWAEIARKPDTCPEDGSTPGNLAYVIYTSGSTGTPKGAMNTHRAIVNRLLWMQDAYQLTGDDRVLQKTPFSFDVSVWEFFWPLLTGARLIIAQPGGHRDSAYLVRLIAREQITTLHFVPPMLQAFLDEAGVEQCTSLRRVICSGEALPLELQKRFFARLNAELHNLYGPTEAAVDVTFWACERQTRRRSVPIGRPIANIQLYVLDAQLQPVPIGVSGELHLGGIGLARGYLNQPDLTTERFIPHPFNDELGARLYKTGDLARYLSDGTIEFLGRLDHQVKIRGFRIELGEIEAVLGRHSAVREAVVIAREDTPGEKRLVAYIVPSNEGRWTSDGRLADDSVIIVADLRRFLQEKLPDYMVPSAFVVLQVMPLSPNGKVDRRALPAPDTARPNLEQNFIAPRNEIEERLAKLWSEVLNINQIGIDDNFFDLGGNSFKAIQVVQTLGEAAAVLDLFKSPTIRQFAEHLTQPREDDPSLLHELTNLGDKARFSLVCVPYGGGHAIIYQPLIRLLPEGYALYSVALPGHDFTRKDKELRPLRGVAQVCMDEIQSKIKGPLALYGHCVGVALTIEIARLLEEVGREIKAIYLAGAFPLGQRKLFNLNLSKLMLSDYLVSDRKIHSYLKFLGGFEGIVDSEELAFVMKSFRHDGQSALEYFDHLNETRLTKRLKTPILCIVGDKDPLTKNYQKRFKEWERFSDSVRLFVVPGGGHYFVKHQAADVARIIMDTIQPQHERYQLEPAL